MQNNNVRMSVNKKFVQAMVDNYPSKLNLDTNAVCCPKQQTMAKFMYFIKTSKIVFHTIIHSHFSNVELND